MICAATLIASNTVRELVRSKLLYNMVIFAALLIASSMFVAQLTVGQWDRIILDQGLAALEIGGNLIGVLVGVNLIAGEVERRTIFPTLAKPLTRTSFLLGRYLGLVAVLAGNVCLMAGVLAAVLKLAGYGVSFTAVAAVLLIAVELALLAAVAMLFSSFSTPMLASGFSLSFFLIGHLLGDLRAFAERSTSEAAKKVAGLVYQLLPDLELLNLKARAANGLAVEGRFVVASAAYGLCYAAVIIALAILVFSRRDLK